MSSGGGGQGTARRRSRTAAPRDEPVRFVLAGRHYVILPEQVYLQLRSAGEPGPDRVDASSWAVWETDATALGLRLVERRREAALTQAGLARLAGIRVETLNRIERGRTTPDFGTVRKLVLALRSARTARVRGRRGRE